MHLFTDALTYSTRYLNGTYQLRRVVNLRECQVGSSVGWVVD